MNTTFFRVPMKPAGGMPTYQQQQPAAEPGAGVSARLSDAAGAIYQQGANQRTKGLDTLGQGIQQAAKAGYDLYTDYQTSKAKDAWLQYKQGAQKLQADLNTLQGKDAVDPQNGVEAKIKAWREQQRQEISKNLGGMAAGQFARAADSTDAGMDAWATGKVHAEKVNYGNEQSAAYIQLRQNEALANADNPAAMEALLREIDTEISDNMAPRNGWDATIIQAKQQAIRLKTLTQAISDKIAGEQLGAANNMLKLYGPQLGGAAEGLRARAAAKGRELEARARADAERAESEGLKRDVNKFFANTSGMSPTEKLTELQKRFGDDPKKQRQFRAGLDTIAYEEGAKQDIQNKEQAIRLKAIEGKITEAAQGTPEESFKKTRAVIKELPLQDQPKALKLADNIRAANMPGRDVMKDDPIAKYEISTRIANGEDVSVDAEYGSRLSKVTREKYKNEAFRSALPSVKTAFEVEAATWMGANKSQAKAALGKGSVDALWTRFLDQTNADEKKDPARLRQEARDFFKAVTLEAGFFGRDKNTIQGLQNFYLDKYDDARPAQGTPEYASVVRALKNSGKKPEGLFGKYSNKQLSTGYRILIQGSAAADGGE